MSYSLNSFKGVMKRMGTTTERIKGDTRSSDYGSNTLLEAHGFETVRWATAATA